MPYKDLADNAIYRKTHLKKYREYQKNWRIKNLESEKCKNRIRRRKRRGMIDPPGDTRSGPCEICSKVQEQLACDHDPSTGKFRGWICRSCNRGMHVLDTPYLLEKMQKYKHSRP